MLMLETSVIGVLVLAGMAIPAQGECPNIVSRTEWEAKESKGTLEPLNERPAPYVVIHHADTRTCTDRTICEKKVRSIQSYHQDHNGWQDIGYNFLIGEDGNAYEGRGWNKIGAHAPVYNSRSIGICIIGTFQTTLPNEAALNAVKSLIECGVEMGEIKSEYKLVGHRQVRRTDCPGQKLYEEIQTWPRYEPNPA